MKYKKIIIIIILILIIGLILYILESNKRTDVYLGDFIISQDGKTMTLKVGVSSSAGYIRKMTCKTKNKNKYCTFYKTFGINSKKGSKNTFTIEIAKNEKEIYFYRGNKEYQKVLELNQNNEWIIVK